MHDVLHIIGRALGTTLAHAMMVLVGSAILIGWKGIWRFFFSFYTEPAADHPDDSGLWHQESGSRPDPAD